MVFAGLYPVESHQYSELREALEKLRKQVPPSITELLKIPGLGPKRVRALYASGRI